MSRIFVNPVIRIGLRMHWDFFLVVFLKKHERWAWFVIMGKTLKEGCIFIKLRRSTEYDGLDLRQVEDLSKKRLTVTIWVVVDIPVPHHIVWLLMMKKNFF